LSVVACLFALLGADFLAATQLLLYVGGIMIIMLFVIMLSQQRHNAPQTNQQWVWAAALSLTVAGVLIYTFRDSFKDVPPTLAMQPTTARIGQLLLGDMLVPFEAISLVLLAALVGAVVFAQDTLPPSK
jgi:NADH:ubiquinone oxidoreductase subunit 6 (subunit J)